MAEMEGDREDTHGGHLCLKSGWQGCQAIAFGTKGSYGRAGWIPGRSREKGRSSERIGH